MTNKKTAICNHIWEPMYEFKTSDGRRLRQERCKKCQSNRYVELEVKDSEKQSK